MIMVSPDPGPLIPQIMDHHRSALRLIKRLLSHLFISGAELFKSLIAKIAVIGQKKLYLGGREQILPLNAPFMVS